MWKITSKMLALFFASFTLDNIIIIQILRYLKMTASGKLLLLKLFFAENKQVTPRYTDRIRLKSNSKMKEWEFVLCEL